MFEAENALPLVYYYHGLNSVGAIPHAVDFGRYDVTRFVVRSESDLAATMPRTADVWLITAGECTSANVAFGCPLVERFIASRYRVVSDATFFRSRVRLLHRSDGEVRSSSASRSATPTTLKSVRTFS